VSKKLYVGNLPYTVKEEGLRDLFAQYGEVQSVNIVTDKYTGVGRGFGFIEMENADAAVAELNDKEFEGRTLRVNEARERKPRGRNDGQNHRGGGGGGGNRWRSGGGGGGGGNRGHRGGPR